MSVIRNTPNSMMELNAYPRFMVIENKSPAVSPSVVAQIFMIQKNMVIAGSLFITHLPFECVAGAK
jgi:hypothetical protein